MPQDPSIPGSKDTGHAYVHPPYLTEEEKRIDEDYEWALHDPEVRRQYGGQVVAVYQKRVWGAGRDHGVASRSALATPGCPERRFLALVVVPDDMSRVLPDTADDEDG
jgi:hypothetical protein